MYKMVRSCEREKMSTTTYFRKLALRVLQPNHMYRSFQKCIESSVTTHNHNKMCEKIAEKVIRKAYTWIRKIHYRENEIGLINLCRSYKQEDILIRENYIWEKLTNKWWKRPNFHVYAVTLQRKYHTSLLIVVKSDIKRLETFIKNWREPRKWRN
jgi:hypothetical protein